MDFPLGYLRLRALNRKSPILPRVSDERVKLTIIRFCKRLKDSFSPSFYGNKRTAKGRTSPKPLKSLPYWLSDNGDMNESIGKMG